MEAFVHGEIHEFPDWYDEDGNVINASDGGVIYAEGKYHWYGQAFRPMGFATQGEGGQSTTTGVVMYASEDLLHWTYEGVILACSTDPTSPLYAPMRFERPKIVYNEKTKQYVLWCHYVKHPGDHGFLPGTGEAGVAYCDKVNGSYTWVGSCRPINEEGIVRDCTLYKDKDGTAYFIYDRHPIKDKENKNRCLHIVKLTEDYLAPTNEYKRIEAGFLREAPAVVYHDGYYYMVTSGLTGWATNQAKYLRARTLLGEWKDMGDPCVGDETHTTFETQTTYIFRVEGTDTYIHMAERHNTENFLHCSYVWLPIEFGADHTLSLIYRKEWKL
ncbi:MAG: family 43 glycosylhydrolase [Clostridia bacterium]|nr:family 43 glycosylhydrolase [Clostridia bacterium]